MGAAGDGKQSVNTILGHPARLVPAAFLVAILCGTALLMLPVAQAQGAWTPFLAALFTSTSAVCVTGLAVVDTAAHWSPFGRVVILGLIQIGGFGMMTSAALLGALIARRLSFAARRLAQAEARGLSPGEVVGVLRLVLLTTVAVELLVAAAVALRLRHGHGLDWDEALWHGVFHAVSAFNNAGFSTWSDSLMGFTADPLLLAPIALAVILGGLGAPVLADLRRCASRPARWSLHTKLTLLGTALLLAVGAIATLLGEWNNPGTLGALAPADRVGNALFHSVMLRTAGFNALNIGAMRDETLAVGAALMLIGGGSAGTAGGIKVTTFLLLGLVVWAVVRGERDTAAFGRRVPDEAQREALTVVLLAVGLVSLGSLLLLSITHLPPRDVVFEAVSAFATVGLSTGITPDLPPEAQAVLIVLMFVGRIGPVTAAAALALRARPSPYRYPEERPIVG
ncbi:MAG: TrkH family potassium uptake protein [Rubritepida sp.]|nr:TrkH family potassium uptake protein [Rubritepida sp.]